MRIYKVNKNKILPGKDIFDLHQTHGITLEISAIFACQNRMIIDWTEFIQCAIDAGWKTDNLIERCRNACKDAGYNEEVMSEIGELVE